MSEKPELAALKMEIVEQWSREELFKLVLRQQKLIEKLGSDTYVVKPNYSN